MDSSSLANWTSEPPHDKTNKMTVRPSKTQISMGIRLVWSESLPCAQWVAKDPSLFHADSEDSDQTERMPRLIWVFAGRTVILLVLSWDGSSMFVIQGYLVFFNFEKFNTKNIYLKQRRSWSDAAFFSVCSVSTFLMLGIDGLINIPLNPFSGSFVLGRNDFTVKKTFLLYQYNIFVSQNRFWYYEFDSEISEIRPKFIMSQNRIYIMISQNSNDHLISHIRICYITNSCPGFISQTRIFDITK